MSLRKYTYRSMQQRPGRTILTLLSIVIGVAAAVAIGLGTATTRNAYKQMFAMVNGRASLQIDGKGQKAFDGSILAKIEEIPGVQAVAPTVESQRPVTVGQDQNIVIQILGIDPVRDKNVRDYRVVIGRMVESGNELALEQEFARFLKLKVGDKVRMSTTNKRQEFEVVGLFSPNSGAALSQLAMAFVPIETAQRYFYIARYVPKGSIDKIQIVTSPSADPDEVLTKIAAILPEDVQVHRPVTNSQQMKETLLSAEKGLLLTTLFTLLMSGFIILNTFLMNVSERRRHLSIMRAVGATRQQITRSLISESILLGILGTLIGIVMGVVAAFVVTAVVARAFQVDLPRLVEVMTIWPFVIGAGFGIFMSVAGAIVPAWLAGRVSPLEGMNRIVPPQSKRSAFWSLVAGTILAGGSFAGIMAGILGYVPVDITTWFGPTFLIGVVILNGLILAPQARFMAALLAPWRRVEANLALKQVLRNHTRSVLTVSVIFIAGSTGVGMANSIMDNVRNVHDWFGQAIAGDYFVRTMMPNMATGETAPLPEGIEEELRQLPHLQSFEGASYKRGVIPTPGQDEEGLQVSIIARTFSDRPPRFDLITGDLNQLVEQMKRGDVVISTVVAKKLNLKVGDKLPLETSEGVKQLPICGITNEYLFGGLAVHVHRDFGVKYLGITGHGGFGMEFEPAYRDAVLPQLTAICEKYEVLLIPYNELRQKVDRIVGGVQWSLWVLVLLGFVVAAFGVVNTLTMNVLEQTRELGLLRIVAMTKDQVRRTIVTQAIIIGGIGLPPGIAMGVGVAYILNLAMQPAFGRPIAFHMHPWLLVGALSGSFVIVLIAAILPALRATRINVVEALHYE